ncbi:thiamine pyrophosphate-dependent dehydrogenase E1 component subunit alpha [Aliiroseovarius sp. F20344]|uniref:thiamine pyrophosphate-dependent dehydrogenase E1 component subunit alpha n=1 Tax=Aliiroseovarius sp. F20344 TaxID=2926414 RepID=UPI001FF6D76C|nr:thiamine pyrophosphate-dependent dehydrogenase E1 component subunit alpha [Aliiroseovarius sp. F20344]MCK0143089.1 thiamine pyrophosphate-dependent dehydrogenase E1 component subunit alpha [Aliiroseovarius sp. F20344]
MNEILQNIDAEVLGAELPRTDRFYRQLVLIRRFEQKLLELFTNNLLAGTTHTSMGQEANAVAIMEALELDKDMVWSNHRCHGHFLSYCGQSYRLFAEILGRRTGACGGRGGSQHLHWRNFYSSGIQGGFAAAAVGAALAEKDKGAISCIFMGDGTMGEGAVYEALNFASLLSAPVLFVVEDNGIAQTTPKELGVAGSITDRAKAFGIDCHHIASTDADDIYKGVAPIVDQIRSSGRPAWLHLETVRLGPHSKGDDTRDETYVAELQKRDPLVLYRDRVSDPDALEQWCDDHIAEVLEVALKDEVACAS